MVKKDRNKDEDPRPKRTKEYISRKQVKSTLKKWEDIDWEELGSDTINKGESNARDDRE